MKNFLTTFIITFALIAVGVIVVSIIGQYYLLSSDGITLPQRFSLLPGIAVSAGVLIAALTFVREREKTEIERQRHVSDVLLSQASDGFNTVIELLSDQNNDRMTWVRAARTLLQSQRLGTQIHSEEYRLAYKLQEERVRNDLYMILTLYDEKTHARQPLPPQFFYGIDNWATCKKLDEAAISASQEPVAYKIEIDSVPPQPSLRPLSERSVIAIFSFIEYPEDYDDPLNNVPEWGENFDQTRDIDQGARRYVAHRKIKYAVGGKIYDRKGKEDHPGE